MYRINKKLLKSANHHNQYSNDETPSASLLPHPVHLFRGYTAYYINSSHPFNGLFSRTTWV